MPHKVSMKQCISFDKVQCWLLHEWFETLTTVLGFGTTKTCQSPKLHHILPAHLSKKHQLFNLSQLVFVNMFLTYSACIQTCKMDSLIFYENALLSSSLHCF